VPATSHWELDPENSSITFVCKHVFTNVRGMLQRPSGTLTIDDAAPAKSQVKASVAVETISTGVEERDTHLKSADFFDAAKFPEISFASTSVSSAGGGAFKVTGDLSMHGVTKPVTLAVTASPPFNHAGGIRRAIEASTTVNRRDFGLQWDFPGEGTGVVVGDTIKISIDAELVLLP
jgi:polyisoprenoid-binding protein YceI